MTSQISLELKLLMNETFLRKYIHHPLMLRFKYFQSDFKVQTALLFSPSSTATFPHPSGQRPAWLYYWPARKDFFRVSALSVLAVAERDSIHFIVKLSIHVLQGDSARTIICTTPVSWKQFNSELIVKFFSLHQIVLVLSGYCHHYHHLLLT